MKLLYTPSSPYARKVRVVAHEAGLTDRLELVFCNPLEEESLRDSNPLGRIPALVSDDGSPTLFDSLVICLHLDSLHGGPKLVPEDGPERWRVLRLHALAQGITDACVNLRQQGMRSEGAESPLPEDWWFTRQHQAINSSLDRLEVELGDWSAAAPVNLGQIAVAVSLGYWEFRFADQPWRNTRPGLARWFETFAQRTSMRETRHEPGKL